MTRPPNKLLIKSLRLFIVSLAGLTLAAGCAANNCCSSTEKRSDPPAQQESSKNRLIIKFKSRDTDPQRPGFVESLSRDAGAAVSYIRPMSDGAHVFLVKQDGTKNSIENIIRQLSDRSDILYIELDAILRHQ